MVSASSEQADIVLVSSSALSGPAAQLGLKLNQGANIYFDHINKLGGIENQKIKFISLDDGYEPYKALQNTQKLLNRGDVFAFFNYVGTSVSISASTMLKLTALFELLGAVPTLALSTIWLLDVPLLLPTWSGIVQVPSGLTL